MGVKVIAGPLFPRFPIEECRQQCEVVAIDVDSDGNESHPDDALILRKLAAAVAHAEKVTGLSIAQKTIELALDSFPAAASASSCSSRSRGQWFAAPGVEIELPTPPVREIVSVTHVIEDSDGELVEETLEPSLYSLDNHQQPAWLFPAINTSWPTTTASVINAVKIQMVVGFGEESDGDPCPDNIREAIMLLLGHLYRFREDSTDKAIASIPNGFASLLAADRIRFAFA